MLKIVEIFKKYKDYIGSELDVKGWVKTFRSQKHVFFFAIYDGTTQMPLQVVADPKSLTNVLEVSRITTGSSLVIRGKLIESPTKGQLFELSASAINVQQIADHGYPLQKLGLPIDFIRTFPHLRHRTALMRAIFKIKSEIIQSIHKFFRNKYYTFVDLPILSTNACEGGCQPLQVTSLLTSDVIDGIPTVVKDGIKTSSIDYSKDFFDRPVYLTVSNQLHLECLAHGMGYVYTITPATRGEPSQSTKHLAHFQMLEYEGIFEKLSDNIDLSESLIKYCIQRTLVKCNDELEIISKWKKDEDKVDQVSKLKKLLETPFIRITHLEAIKLLKQAHLLTPFVDKPEYTGDLSGEHERWLVKNFGLPVVVMRYPKMVKAFYMPVSEKLEVDDEIIEYVECFDLLMDIGEVVGGSMRIWKESELLSRMHELHMDPKDLDWYLDLRRYGSTPHGGMGLGIERLVAAITGTLNVKDCISFPITVHHCEY